MTDSKPSDAESGRTPSYECATSGNDCPTDCPVVCEDAPSPEPCPGCGLSWHSHHGWDVPCCLDCDGQHHRVTAPARTRPIHPVRRKK